MRKLLTILLLFASLIARATDYYIATAALGGDNNKTGLVGQPWRTLKYACDNALVSGDIIHVGVGTFNEGTDRSYLRPGVSIAGAGVTSIIITGYKGTSSSRDATIMVETLSEGSAGGQSIHDLKFDGQYYGTNDAVPDSPFTPPASSGGKTAISVHCRNNVEIYNCTFQNFWHSAVVFYGGLISWSQTPIIEGTYAEGNSYHDNISTNCSFGNPPPFTWVNSGHVFIQGQKDLLIYNNTMTQTGRNPGYNGMCIDGVEGFYKGMKIYNNEMYQTPYSNEVGFSIELWYTRGGIEIYGNTIPMQVDLARGIIKGTYAFGAKVYNNTIGHPTLYALCTSPIGVMLEWDVQDVYIYNNIIKKFGIGVGFYSHLKSSTFERIYIYYNLIYDITAINGHADLIGLWSDEPGYPSTYNNIHIYNNVLYGRSGGNLTAGIRLPTFRYVNNFIIKNNIIQTNSDKGPPIKGDEPTAIVNGLVITNNVFWLSANANNPSLPSNYTQTNYTGPPTNTTNKKENPLFVTAGSNFHLQAGSPAINAGVHLPFSFITTDKDGVAIASPPESGAYEKDGTPPPPFDTATVLTDEIIDIGLTTATGGGNVTDDGGAEVTARGVCWDVTTDPTTADSKTTNGTGLGTFTSSITGLTQNTTYFVRAYATNSVGTAYGNEVTFETGPPHEPEVGTGTVVRTSDSTATGSGNVVDEGTGGGVVSSRGICWSISPNPTKADNFSTAAAGGPGEFTALMTGLSPTIYYVRAWATNQTTTSYGLDVIFNLTKAPLLRGEGDLMIKRMDGSNDLIRLR